MRFRRLVIAMSSVMMLPRVATSWVGLLARNRFCNTKTYIRGRKIFTHQGMLISSSRSVYPSMFTGLHSSQQQSELQTNNFSSTVDKESSQITTLAEMIKESYSIGETDYVLNAILTNGILAKLSTTNHIDTKEIANQLVDAAVKAAGTNRGSLASMINAILGSCCSADEYDAYPEIALAVLDLVDEMHSMDEKTMVAPDIVSLALVFYATSKHDDFVSESHSILERAQRNAKKLAGSQRRRAMAAERRKGGSTTNNNSENRDVIESKLQLLCGSDIRILHETDDVIVVCKPAGVVCYHNKKTSAGKITNSRKKKKSRTGNANNNEAKQIDISLVDALIDSLIPLSTLNPIARGIVHRIDRGTSGAIVLAKTDEYHLRLVALFFLRKVKKKYLALVPRCSNIDDDSTSLTLGSSGVIDVPVDGRSTRSKYEVIKEYGEESLLLEVETFTGRKHQVRVHCASLGHPVFLDPIYFSPIDKTQKVAEKGKTKKVNVKADNTEDDKPIPPKALSSLIENDIKEKFFLHAATLSIQELGVSVDAPLPKWWLDTIQKLED